MKRNPIPDVMRGVGLLSVVVSHSIATVATSPQSPTAVLIQNIIGAFFMPLFFMVSGYLMFLSLKGSRRAWLKNKAVYLLIPHFLFNLGFYFLSATRLPPMQDYTQTMSFPRYLFLSVFYDDGEWFLWTLFFTFAVMLAVDLANRRLSTRWFVVSMVVLVAIDVIALQYLKTFTLFRISYLLYYLPYCVFGYVVGKHGKGIFGYLASRPWVFWGVWASELYIQALNYSVPLKWHGLIVIVYGLATLYVRRQRLFRLATLVELAVLPAWMYWWYFVMATSTIAGTTLFRYAMAFQIMPLVFMASVIIARIKYLNAVFFWLGQNTLGLYLFSISTSGLGFGVHITRMVTNIMGSLASAVVLTWIVNRVRALRVLLGDISYYREKWHSLVAFKSPV